MDVDAALPGMDVIALQQRHLGSSWAVMVGQVEERPVPLVFDDDKGTAPLVLGEKRNILTFQFRHLAQVVCGAQGRILSGEGSL